MPITVKDGLTVRITAAEEPTWRDNSDGTFEVTLVPVIEDDGDVEVKIGTKVYGFEPQET